MTGKVLPTRREPYSVNKTTAHTVTIAKGDLSNTVSINRVTQALKSETTLDGEGYPTAPPDPFQLDPNESYSYQPTEEYAVLKFVYHRDTPTGIKYQVPWYSYSRKNDTFEPAENIPDKFVATYWNSIPSKEPPAYDRLSGGC